MRFYLVIALMVVILRSSYDYRAFGSDMAEFRRVQLDPPVTQRGVDPQQRDVERQRAADLEARWHVVFRHAG